MFCCRHEQSGDDRAGWAGIPDGAARPHALPRVQDPPQGGGHGSGQRLQGMYLAHYKGTDSQKPCFVIGNPYTFAWKLCPSLPPPFGKCCSVHLELEADKLICASLKGTVASVWVWLKVVWLEGAIIEKEPLSIFKTFLSSFDFQ